MTHKTWLEHHRKKINSKFNGNAILFLKDREVKQKEKARIRAKKYRTEHKKKIMEYRQTHKREHRNAIKRRKKRLRDHKDKILMQINHIVLPKGGYANMFNEQYGRCKLCRRRETVHKRSGKIKDLAVDDNHRTKHVRGLLCSHCNIHLVGSIEQIMELPKVELLQILRHIGIKTILKKIDRVCDSSLLELYLAKNRLHPYKSKFPVRDLIWERWHHVSLYNYSLLMKDQKGVCKLCGGKETVKARNGMIRALSGDHSHRTNRVRGILCHNCNLKVGRIDKILDLSDFWLYKVMQHIGVKRILKKLTITIELK